MQGVGTGRLVASRYALRQRRAALGAIEEMETHDLPGRARQIERIFRTRLSELADDHPSIGEIRGRGAMMAVELVEPGTK